MNLTFVFELSSSRFENVLWDKREVMPAHLEGQNDSTLKCCLLCSFHVLAWVSSAFMMDSGGTVNINCSMETLEGKQLIVLTMSL